MKTPIARIETLTSPPITIQDTRVNVRSQLVRLRFPAIHGGLLWNRPVAVVVRTEEGEERSIPIPDPTRTVMLTLAGLGLIGIFVRIVLRRKKARS